MFYAFFGGFYPGEGFFYCIKISRNIDPNKCIGCGICTTRCKFDAIHLRRIRPEFANYINGDYSKQAIIKHGIKRAAKLTIKRIQGKV